MKILAISGAHRKSNTEAMLQNFIDGCISAGASVELIKIRDSGISPCCGWSDCYYKNYCIIKDKMQELYKKMDQADRFVFASPTYFDNMSTYMKLFFDRLNPYCKPPRYKDKKVFLISVGGASLRSIRKGLITMKRACFHLKIKVAGSLIGVADHENEMLKNKKVLKSCFKAGVDFTARKFRK